MVIIICILTVLALSKSSLAMDIEPQGFVDTYHAVQVRDPYDYLTSRTRLRLGGWFSSENASMFFSMNAVQNNVISDNTGLELREAFIDYQAESWDLRAGRQIIVWGKADGLAITDIVSPWDLTEFLARDFDDIRIPVDAARLRLLTNSMTFEMLWLPKFVAAILPSKESPWALAFEPPAGTTLEYDETIFPENTLRNSETGARLSAYLPGVDFSISFFNTWDDMPAMHRSVRTSGPDTVIRYFPKHHRLTCVGSEFSLPRGDFVFRGESAFYFNKRFEPEDPYSETIFKRNVLIWMLGFDWTPGGDWSVTTQFSENSIFNYDEEMENDEHTLLATLRVSKKLMHQTLELSTMMYLGITDEDAFIRPQADYAVTDGFHLLAGADVFIGDKGFLAQFNDNDDIWMKARFNF